MSADTLRDFLIAYVATAVAFLVIGLVADAAIGLDISSAAQFAPLFFAALRASHCHAKRGGEPPAGAEAWRASRHMALASTTVVAIFLLADLALNGVASFTGEDVTDHTASMIVVIALGLSYGFDMLLMRFTFPWMVRNQINVNRNKR